MKNYFFIATTVFLFSACNQAEIEKTKAELARMNHQNDSLITIANERETSINDFISSFNEVERNLDSVTSKQHVIIESSEKGTELKKSKKERINEEIKAINNLMDSNYKMIASLKKKLKNSLYKNSQLEKTINLLNEQLAQKNTELAVLNEKLNMLNVQVAQLQTLTDTLTTQNTEKAKDIAEKTAALHTAYYVIGKSKDLQVSKIIDREGGLLGMGKISKLNENIDKSKFTQIDYTAMSKIPINGDGVKIVTTHPADSYTLDKDAKDKDMVKNLIITNPEKFWSASKYLVIVKS